ncbi:MAG: hypothetical protein IJ888_10865 [Prevotella sp.]|nr:hypothetical protein [Prevotella sp.]
MRRLLFLVTTILLMVQGASAWNGSGSSGAPYLIASPADWETFATSTDEYSDTFFKLTADITVTTMRTKTFKGTFDGGGHTLTFNYTATGNNAAPFAYITGATIKNLRVAGTINSGYMFAAGIVAISNGGTITNCQSSVTINSSKSGDGTHGGLVADSYTGTLNITNCLFDGKLLGTTTTSCGGIVGWHKQGTLNITNTLFAPAEVTVQGGEGAIFARNGATLTNCYYISDWAAATVQGTNANSMTTAALVTALNGSNKNWCIHRGNAIPIMVNLVISTKAQWDTFAANVGNYDGKYVQLSANIGTANAPITTMTTSATSFKGIFDGNGYTLTVNLSGSSYTAPFSLLNDGTIMNLHVEGSVTVTGDYGGGLVCRTSWGDNLIDNCVVNTNVNGVSYIGGVIAHAYNAKKLTISNCVYGGTLTQSGGYIGGIFGWYNNNNNTNLNLIMHNCLFKGTYVGNGQFHPIGVKKLAATFSNLDCRDCFYTANPTTPDDPDRFFTDGTKVSELTIGTTGVSIASGSYATFQGTKYYYGTVTLDYNGPMATTNFSLDGTHLNDNSFTISTDNAAFDDGTATIKWDFPGRGTVEDPYQISSAAVWNYLADQVAAGNTYSGKYFQLTEDIGTAQNPITTMVGIFSDTESDKRPFSGTFDGYGHTITVNYHETRTALFSYVKVATIRNLIVAGNCGTAGRAASIVGESDESDGLNTVTNCVSSVTISGSLVGGIALGGNVDIRGCLFNGTINGTSQSGGIVCWGKNITKITNCVFAPQAGSSISGGTFCYTGEVGATVTNCYYTTALGTAQGKQARSISAGDDVTISNLGSASATYNVSGITAYSHGIKYNDIYYAGDGDAVSLNLSHADKAGYTFNQYTVTGGGSLTNIDATSATLTMSAANQTIDAQWTENVATLNETANALDELTAMSGKQTKVTFTRSELTANSYSTMCLPFDFTAPSGCTFYAFTGVEWSTTNDQWEATITEQASATTLSAHTPYIFKCTGTSATFTNNAVIAASSYDNALVEVGATSGTDQAWKFKGTYTPLSWASADPTEPTYGFSTYVPNETIAAGTFVRFVKGASLAPFRARLIYSGTDTHLNAPRRAGANELPVIIIVRIIGINGETTSIGTLDTRTGEVTTDGWYTLGGMKLKGQPNQQGIYIHNGRKEVIR